MIIQMPSRLSSRRMTRRAATRWLASGTLCLLLPACGSLPQPRKERADLHVRIKSGEGTNPDDKGRPAPVMVRIYELKSATAFENADFFTLHNDSRKVLGEDALAMDEFILRPGDTRDIRRRANPATVAIGVLAAYRELGKSVWRAVYQAPPVPEEGWYRAVMPRTKVRLNVDIGQQAILVTELD
ncbi:MULTISPECIES: type VI secretion system lipoprotein TssJ [Cupriavidus]|uniref:type VI secretion system lipoprotein TssJ n=1 Tax=Cupriavidus TaxID=106589 RepID=UPI0003A0CADD|nr:MULTISPECIES: type VI secretion system lipoprotein TssJ [Cupriavidus]